MIVTLSGLLMVDQSFSKHILSFLLSKLKMLLCDLAKEGENTFYKSMIIQRCERELIAYVVIK